MSIVASLENTAAKEGKTADKARARGSAKKRPAAAAAITDTGPMKKPAAAAAPAPSQRRTEQRPPMPPCGLGNGSVKYKQGKVLPSVTKQAFRVWLDPSKSLTDKNVKWSDYYSRAQAWQAALDLIDDASA